jgi:hypothetical protein
MNTIFLIEKGWIDPMENRTATGYDIYSYTMTEEEAKTFCDSKGFWTAKDCWEIQFSYNGKMSKFRYKEVKLLNNEKEKI